VCRGGSKPAKYRTGRLDGFCGHHLGKGVHSVQHPYQVGEGTRGAEREAKTMEHWNRKRVGEGREKRNLKKMESWDALPSATKDEPANWPQIEKASRAGETRRRARSSVTCGWIEAQTSKKQKTQKKNDQKKSKTKGEGARGTGAVPKEPKRSRGGRKRTREGGHGRGRDAKKKVS